MISIKYSPNLQRIWKNSLQCGNQNLELEDSKMLFEGLVETLEQTLETAICAGIEFEDKFGITDLKIYSIEQHKQDYLREGIYKLVRVIADIWELIAREDEKFALGVVKKWGEKQVPIVTKIGFICFGKFYYTEKFCI